MTSITLNKGGTAECVVDSATVQIPDLWHIAEHLADDGSAQAADNVRKVWHLAADLLTHIREDSPEREPSTERVLSWSLQNGCSLASDALDAYCAARGLNWSDDAMYSYVTFTEI